MKIIETGLKKEYSPAIENYINGKTPKGFYAGYMVIQEEQPVITARFYNSTGRSNTCILTIENSGYRYMEIATTGTCGQFESRETSALAQCLMRLGFYDLPKHIGTYTLLQCIREPLEIAYTHTIFMGE